MYVVIIDWDKPNDAPFGTEYISQPFRKKSECWAYVRRVMERASIAGIQLHNIMVFKTKNKFPSGKALWVLHDPRVYGDSYPER